MGTLIDAMNVQMCLIIFQTLILDEGLLQQ